MSASRSAFSFQPKASHKDEQQRGKIQHSNTRLRLHIIHHTVFSTYSPIPFMSHPHRLPTCPSPKHFSLSSSSLLSPCNPSPNSPPYTRHRLRRPFILPRTLLLHTLYHNLVFKLPRSLQMHFGCRPQFRTKHTEQRRRYTRLRMSTSSAKLKFHGEVFQTDG
jgi:hypothetical protein